MVRKALLIAAGFAVVASVASAGVPDPRFSSIESVVVGAAAQFVAPVGVLPGYDVTVRDVSNAPLAGVTVTLNFSASGMKVFTTPNGGGSGTTVNCAAKSISRVTNGAGQVNFGSRVAKFNNANTVEVSANGVVLGNVKGRSTDIDGTDGKTGLGDFVLFSSNFLSVPSAQETDFDLNGTTGLGDFVMSSDQFLHGPTLATGP
jgi:hypothetical protein